MTIEAYFKVEKFKATMELGKINKVIDTKYILKGKPVPKKLEAKRKDLVSTVNSL